jgi:hypothetical protein
LSLFSDKELRGRWLIELKVRELLVILIQEGEAYIDMPSKINIIKLFNDMAGATKERWGDPAASTILMATAK